MPFALTSDHELIRKTVAEFADAEIAGKPADKLDRERRFPTEILKNVGGLGLLGMLVPPDDGGAGTDTVSFCLAVEELAARSGSVAFALAQLNALGSLPVAAHGSDDLKSRWLPSLVTGEKFAAWGLTEPNAGSDLEAVSTTALKDGDDYVLNGLKSFVVGAHEADVFIVFAKTVGEEADGFTAFLVPKDADGVRLGDPERSMTLRGAPMAQVFLKDVHVPAADRLGDVGQGLAIALEALEANRLGLAAVATGLMRASVDASNEFANQRQQFGQAIKNFQGVQWRITDMDVNVRAARLLTLYAAAKRDRGEDYADDAAAAKLFTAEAAKDVTQKGILVHGGSGFMREVPVERINRDARALSIAGGTSEVQRASIAAKLLNL